MRNRKPNQKSSQSMKRAIQILSVPALIALGASLFVGCQAGKHEHTVSKAGGPAATAPAAAATPAKAVEPKSTLPTVRINCGTTAAYTDANGNAWLPDQGFIEGEVIDRAADLPIANTKDPAIYRTERYSMKSFSHALPNGKYTVKLHFAETFEGITAAGERVFSFNVEGQEFKDFDVFVKAGGAQKAYVESVNVDITDGKLDITFTSNIENPEINGIEIIPRS